MEALDILQVIDERNAVLEDIHTYNEYIEDEYYTMEYYEIQKCKNYIYSLYHYMDYLNCVIDEFNHF
jgi:hypothetical protein